MALSLPTQPPDARLWANPVAAPEGISDAVDVWRVDLGGAAAGLEDLLCVQERARAGRLVRARQRTLWVRSRGTLRALLGRYLDREPRELRFELGAHGKPALCDGGSLRFNLSHSGELMLVAVTAGREIGVDVERPRERYTEAFLRAWTMREAAVKCLGIGLGSAPLLAGDASAQAAEGKGALDVDGLWTAELDLGPGAIAAVAATSPSPRASAPRWRRGLRAGCPPSHA